ncbi:MAG: hypothetical protein JOY71_05055 [Acetobacteraceae bacterium]|nr:hypothetical protein [Acetobacteraceae bacterium]
MTKKGGEIILAEPDWGTFFVGARSVYADGVSEYFGGKFKNPNVGRRVVTLLQSSGVEIIDLRVTH